MIGVAELLRPPRRRPPLPEEIRCLYLGVNRRDVHTQAVKERVPHQPHPYRLEVDVLQSLANWSADRLRDRTRRRLVDAAVRSHEVEDPLGVERERTAKRDAEP